MVAVDDCICCGHIFHASILQSAGRRFGEDSNLLAAALDLTKSAIILPRDTLEELAAEARKRALSPEELASKILATMVSDGTVDMVIDGGRWPSFPCLPASGQAALVGARTSEIIDWLRQVERDRHAEIEKDDRSLGSVAKAVSIQIAAPRE